MKVPFFHFLSCFALLICGCAGTNPQAANNSRQVNESMEPRLPIQAVPYALVSSQAITADSAKNSDHAQLAESALFAEQAGSSTYAQNVKNNANSTIEEQLAKKLVGTKEQVELQKKALNFLFTITALAGKKSYTQLEQKHEIN